MSRVLGRIHKVSIKIHRTIQYTKQNFAPFHKRDFHHSFDIFNLSIKTGKFISKLKTAKVIPLYKRKGSEQEVSNSRPIALLSNVEKIFEKLKGLHNFWTDTKQFTTNSLDFVKTTRLVTTYYV